MNLSRDISYYTLALSMLTALCCASCSSAEKIGATRPLGRSSKVLMIGDSLTVGPFGDRLESWLLQNVGPERVAIYGTCGSSPEHWLAAYKNFVSSCGYRETTGQLRVLDDYRKGHRPGPTSTPKLEVLLARHQPQIVIVQLGTNHYDSLLQGGREAIPKHAAIYEEFARALHHPGGSVRMVIWVTPPDSSKFPNWVEDEIDRSIITMNRKYRFGTIYSRRYTRYVPGETGSDGVHYNDAAATLWAAPVIQKLDQIFTKYGVKNQVEAR